MSVATVRLLAADPENYDRAADVGDGVTVDYHLPQSPVVTDSERVFVAAALKAKPADYSIDEGTGVVTFDAAPAAGAEIVITYRHTLLSDAALGELLALEGNNDKLAAAQALDVIASSEALVSKKIQLLDLRTDGPAVAEALRKHAAALRQQAAEATEAADVEGSFDVAELVVDEWTARERINADLLRSY